MTLQQWAFLPPGPPFLWQVHQSVREKLCGLPYFGLGGKKCYLSQGISGIISPSKEKEVLPWSIGWNI